MLASLLQQESILLSLQAQTREGAFAEMIARAPAFWRFDAHKKSELLELLLQEGRPWVFAPAGTAVPSCDFSGVTEPLLLLGISRTGISFYSTPSPVYVVALLLFPENKYRSEDRFMVVSAVAGIFQDPFLRERLKIADTPEDVLEVFRRETVPFRSPQANLR